jgi:hypothetical protein
MIDRNIVAAVVVAQQLFAAYLIFFDDIPTKHEQKSRKKRERELTPYKRNVSVKYSTPTTFLVPHQVLDNLLQDPDRAYIKKHTHLHAWQFFQLADQLKDLIERPRLRDDGTRPPRNGPSVKHDHYHRLFFCLEWLNEGTFHRTRESRAGWSKTSMHEDLIHVLECIVEGLDDHLQWPSEQRREELANQFTGIFHGCIGIADVKEYQIVKLKDPVKERRSWSGKKKINSYKLLSVIDHSGRFIFARLSLGTNDREVYTTSPLYLCEGEFFSDGQFIASDGAFEGDGRFICSYKNPGLDENRVTFNNAFREVRTLVENAYQRVGAWFPLLGNNKRKLNYSERTLILAVQAAVRIHNFIMDTENLSYSALESPEMHFQQYF